MAAMLETVTVTIGGKMFTAWSELAISAGAEKAVRQARLTIPISAVKQFAVGDEAVITAGGEPIVTGFVRDRDRQIDEDDASGTITVVSKTADATESSIEHDTGHIDDATLDKIAKEFGKDFVIIDKRKSKGKPAPHQIVPAETLHKTLERVARRQGVLIYDNGDGAIVLADKPEGTHAGSLVEGVNFKTASVSETESGRYAKTVVRGQSSKGHGAGALRIEGVAMDSSVRKHRTRILLHEGDATSYDLKKRAEWQARRDAGKGLRMSAAAPGWRDANGRLWSPNWLVQVTSDRLDIDQLMAISSVAYSQDDSGGTKAMLSLVDPRAFGDKDPKGKKKSRVAEPKGEVVVVE
jgi:prophage tail gpP-like protein